MLAQTLVELCVRDRTLSKFGLPSGSRGVAITQLFTHAPWHYRCSTFGSLGLYETKTVTDPTEHGSHHDMVAHRCGLGCIVLSCHDLI